MNRTAATFPSQTRLQVKSGTRHSFRCYAVGVFLLLTPPLVSAALFSAVLPASRSALVNDTVTAFATLINAGSEAATGCGITLATPIAARLSYQSADPRTNQATGTADTPVDIAPGSSQSFILAVTPFQAFGANDLEFSFACAGIEPAPRQVGLNTLLVSASLTPTADIVALAATHSGDGIVDLSRQTGGGAFAVATINLGASAQIRVSTDTGGTELPLAVALCETDPATGQCISSIASEIVTTIAANATPTFGVFPITDSVIDFDPAHHRIFVRFRDTDGEVRGATSVAVRTATTDVSFPGGGGVIFADNALPEGTNVTVSLAGEPLLPQELEQIGSVIEIDAGAALASVPAEIRLPLPVGEPLDSLAILRFENDGTTTILGTERQGAELTAGTPGLGRFAVVAARTVPEQMSTAISSATTTPEGPDPNQPRIRASISGPGVIVIGREYGYVLLGAEPLSGSQAPKWSIDHIAGGSASISAWLDSLVFVSSGRSTGESRLSASYIDPFTGFNGKAQRVLRTIEGNGATAQRIELRLAVNTTTIRTNTADELKVTAHVVASPAIDPRASVQYNWDFDDGIEGQGAEVKNAPDLVGDTSVFELPDHPYDATGVYRISVTATHLASNTTGRAEFDVRVLDETYFKVFIMATDTYLAGPGSLTFSSDIIGGTPGFNYRWRVLPGGGWIGTDSERRVDFDEPGSYRVEVEAEDATGQVDRDQRYVTVGGAAPLQANLTLEAESPGAGSISATVHVTGGLRITNGEFRDYQVTVDWGDGTKAILPPQRRQEPADAPREAFKFFPDADEYSIKARVTDATGSQIEVEQRIQVGEPDTGGVPTAALCPESIGSAQRSSFRDNEGWSADCNYGGFNTITIRYREDGGACDDDSSERAVWRHYYEDLASTQRTINIQNRNEFLWGQDEIWYQILDAAVAAGLGAPCR